MLKDTFFSSSRFMNLCRKEMVESWKANLLRMLLMYGVMAIILVWNGYFAYRYYNPAYDKNDNDAWQFATIFFVWALWGFGCLSASFTMERMKSKTGRISALMTPATPFEKFFSRWLLSTVVFLVVFLITFKLADYTRVLVYSAVYPDINIIEPTRLSHAMIGESGDHYCLLGTSNQFFAMLASYFFFQSLFVLGSALWPKNAFLKSFAAIAIIGLIYILTGVALGNMLIKKGTYYDPPFNFNTEQQLFVMGLFLSVFAIFNWVLAYYRYKEAEVIQRM